jgi:hypothetical protein
MSAEPTFPKGPWLFTQDEYSLRPGDEFLVTNHGEEANIAAGRAADEDITILQVFDWGNLSDRQKSDTIRLLERAPLLHMAAKRLVESKGAQCWYDPLNPCWNDRPEDIPGKHWGSGNACPVCTAKAALADAPDPKGDAA